MLEKLNDSDLTLDTGTTVIRPLKPVRDLGVHLASELTMKTHISKVVSYCYHQLRRIRQVRRLVGQDVAQQLVSAFILSRLDYCNSNFTLIDWLIDWYITVVIIAIPVLLLTALYSVLWISKWINIEYCKHSSNNQNCFRKFFQRISWHLRLWCAVGLYVTASNKIESVIAKMTSVYQWHKMNLSLHFY